MTDPEQPSDPQRPGEPEGVPYPQPPADFRGLPYPQPPADREPAQLATNARPIRASRVWAGIGLAFLGHIVAIVLGLGLAWASIAAGAESFGPLSLPVAELLVLVACLVVGIVQLVRGDRGLGVGLLVGWAVTAVIFAGACVALFVMVARSYGG